MKIRYANEGDADVIAAHNIALAKESEHILLTHETTLAGVKAVLSDKSKGFYLVAEDNKTVIGQAMITVEWSDWRNKPIWWIQSVYVQEARRGQGIFTSLLDMIKQLAHQQGVASLRLYSYQTNTSAHRVYEKTGWHQAPYVVYQLPLSGFTR